ncbi:hypothetical protein LSO9J_50040 [Candidatus Liberibacter solanacearum]
MMTSFFTVTTVLATFLIGRAASWIILKDYCSCGSNCG